MTTYYCPKGCEEQQFFHSAGLASRVTIRLLCTQCEYELTTTPPKPDEIWSWLKDEQTDKPKLVAWACPKSTGDNDHDEYLVPAGEAPKNPCRKCRTELRTVSSIEAEYREWWV